MHLSNSSDRDGPCVTSMLLITALIGGALWAFTGTGKRELAVRRGFVSSTGLGLGVPSLFVIIVLIIAAVAATGVTRSNVSDMREQIWRDISDIIKRW